jgi:hypothetical protein
MAKNKRSKNNFKKVKKRITTTLVIIGLISTIGVTGYGIWAARNILQPISIFASDTISIGTNKEESQTLLFVVVLDENQYAKQAELIMINHKDSSIKQTVIPEDTMLHLPYGLNEFKLKSLYKIAQMENPQNTFNLIDQTLIEYFGVSTQKMIIVNNDHLGEATFTNWLQSPQTILKMAFDENWVKDTLQTNQSRFELIKLARSIQNIPDQNTTLLKAEDSGMLEEEKALDNSKIYITDQNKLDTYIKKSFQTDAILEEKADIVIENSTKTQGLASKVSRIVTNSGGVVIEVKNSQNVQEQSLITISDQKWLESATLQQIQTTLPSAKIVTSTETSSKADIVITLGSDYSEIITGQAL